MIDIKVFASKINPAELQRVFFQSYILAFLVGKLEAAQDMKIIPRSEFELDIFSIPFLEAIDFFFKKDLVATKTYKDLTRAAAETAFFSAGATSRDLLFDLHQSVGSAIEQGTSQQDFKKQFTEIAEKNGWSYRGTPSSRSAVIFRTNVLHAYHAGRWQQYGEHKNAFPMIEYRAVGDRRTRPNHMRLNGFIAPYDDAIWATIRPPIDFNCRCTTFPIAKADSPKKLPPAPDLTGIDFFGRKYGFDDLKNLQLNLDKKQANYPQWIKDAFRK